MTKKCLVAFDPERPEAMSSDFLVPVVDDGRLVLFGLKSKKVRSMGMVVYTGRELTPNDVFARLVDTGRRIESVERALDEIAQYLAALKQQGIGTIVSVDRQQNRVVLLNTGIRPASRRPRLP